jgi:hypothetical protein
VSDPTGVELFFLSRTVSLVVNAVVTVKTRITTDGLFDRDKFTR